MADKYDTLGLRTQVEHYSIHDVEYIGVDTIIYRAEDMRVGREVWLREYFPKTIAKRHLKEGGQSTVYVHPTQSEVFVAAKTQQQDLYNSLKGVNTPAIPAVYQTFESGGTLYATTQYFSGMKTLRQLHDVKTIFSEQQISIFALSLVRVLVILQRIGLQVQSLDQDTLLMNTTTNECSVAYAELVPFDEQRIQHLMHEFAIVLYGMIESKSIEDDKPLKPLQPDSAYSAALCGLINRMVFEEATQRPKIFEELQTLLQSHQPNEEECDPMVCKKTDSPFSSFASMASIVLILVFAYYVFMQPKTIDIKQVTWFDAARYHLVAYFGNAKAESGLGQMYENGYGVGRDIKEALFWYKKAAEQGDLYAQLSLAQIYHKGMGVKKNIEEAIHWYEKAALNGDKQVKWQLAKIYMDQKAYDKAQRYYEELARDGNVEAQKNLAYLKVSGKGKKDLEGAFNIFLKLAKTGDLYAKQSLSNMFISGKGTPQKYERAFQVFLVLAKRGDLYAQQILGYLFISGKGVPKDYTQALYWFKQAEKQGDGYSCGAIGEMYLYGLGVSKNREEARYWFEKGLSRNDKYSKRALTKMDKGDVFTYKAHVKYEELPKSYGRYIDYGRYVKDIKTGLLWQKNGRESGYKNFYQAADYAKKLKLDGITGWRVPTAKELTTIFPATAKPFTGKVYVSKNEGRRYSYWTSELDNRLEDYAYVYQWYADGGANNCYASRNYAFVRCVHDPM